MNVGRYFALTMLFALPSCLLSASDEPPAEEGAAIESNAVDEAPDWAIKVGDVQFGSDTLQGKPYVLHFWSTWSPYSKHLQPGLNALALEYQPKGIVTYAISFWENPKADPVQDMKKRDLVLEVLPKGDDVAKAFSITVSPAVLFIDQDGNVVHSYFDSDPNSPELRIGYERLYDGM